MNSTLVTVGATSLKDIEKALQAKPSKTEAELRARIPPEFHDLLPLFRKQGADKLNPNRPGVDHKIALKTGLDGKEMPSPYGPLYGMSREELLVLKKTLKDLLDKGFIRVSSSEAGAPILFVRKPGGGLCFCFDYRTLNAVSKGDRYPLPLVTATSRRLNRRKVIHRGGEKSWFSQKNYVAQIGGCPLCWE